MDFLKSKVYRLFVPKPIRKKILASTLRKSVLNYYYGLPEAPSIEIQDALNYVRVHGISVFPSDFQNKYDEDSIEVLFDQTKWLHYVLMDGKRLYFKKRWSKKRIRHSYIELTKEQDMQSPHRYTTSDFKLEAGEVFVDIGVAEGNFALSVVEQASRLILFEPDTEWIEALNATFEPWKEKVQIVNKFVSDVTNDSSVRLDDYFHDGDQISFLKIDVDGAESRLLDGCKRILQLHRPLKVAVCTYHKHGDADDFDLLLRNYGFETSFTNGYILFFYDKQIKAPFFRRGLIRAVKQ